MVNFATRLSPFDFEHERFDAAIHYGSPYWAGTVATHIFDEEVVPVASRRLAERHAIREPADLARVTLLQQATRPSLWSDWFDSIGVAFEHPFRGPLFDQFSMTAQAAAADLGAALVPRFLVEDEIASGKLRLLFDRPLKGEHAYYLVTPTAKVHIPLVRAFTEWLTAEARR
jgi:LysR family glycine cleavage system transcriptional activator